jgi:hypothetical protein
VVVRSGIAEAPDGRVAHAHGQREQGDDRVTQERAWSHVGGRGNDRGDQDQPDLDRERAGDVLGVTIAGPRRQHAADGRAGEEGAQRHERRDDGQPRAAGDAEPEQHDVPGHVRGEHPPEAEIAHGIDEPRGERQHEQRPSQRMADAAAGAHSDGLAIGPRP